MDRQTSFLVAGPYVVLHAVARTVKQAAQLSQRDRAVGCVSFCQKWKMELGDYTIFYGPYSSIFNHCDIIDLQSYRIRWEKRKIRAITPFKVIQGHPDRYQSKACMRLPISDQ